MAIIWLSVSVSPPAIMFVTKLRRGSQVFQGWNTCHRGDGRNRSLGYEEMSFGGGLKRRAGDIDTSGR